MTQTVRRLAQLLSTVVMIGVAFDDGDHHDSFDAMDHPDHRVESTYKVRTSVLSKTRGAGAGSRNTDGVSKEVDSGKKEMFIRISGVPQLLY
ncbi:hypothetical protein EV363DRAFT_16738 [Boletus edulis]|nr:hypothetical protein EV363DRAFT_16738 [Boletus edulis]